MYFILTDIGVSTIQSMTVPPLLASYSLGSGYNYTPVATQTALSGSVLYQGAPSHPVVESPNLLRYVIVIDASVGDFSYGEVGLFLPGGDMFAIGTSSTLIRKNSVSSFSGNNVVIDCYVPVTGVNYDPYTGVANSASPAQAVAVGSIDSLPIADQAESNLYIVPSRVLGNNASSIATANAGMWSVTGYVSEPNIGTASSSTGSTVTVSGWSPSTLPPAVTFPGEYLIQFNTGSAAGIIRSVASFNSVQVVLENPLSGSVSAGSTFTLFAYSPTRADVALKQDQLKDAMGVNHPAGANVPNVSQMSSAIAAALTTLPAHNLTGLAAEMAAVSAGNTTFTQITGVFGTPVGRVLPN